MENGLSTIRSRLAEQGFLTTLVWIYNRGFSYLSGVPLLRRSRINPQLYVGPQFNRRGLDVLRREGISAVVNMRVEFDDAAENLLLDDYCHLPTVDDEAPSIEHVDEGINFIRRVVAEGGKVYIHCAGGIGRAPTMAAAYLIAEGRSVDEAIAFIKQSRPYIRIMPPQMQLLRKLEERSRERMKATRESGSVYR
ncbi:MAG: dual specificity protein phosphatase family protein [Anaerolineales bacterium]|nr:dual specificity protein phosphatase family protein [Anaerolineales bacterium]